MNDENAAYLARAFNIYDDDEPHALVTCGDCSRPYLYAGDVCPCPSCGSCQPTNPEPIETLFEILPDGRFVKFDPRKK